jgi:hypothetical protein
MSEGRAPTPDFNSGRYERPNKDWVCGNAKDGCPCRIGPSPTGKCRATTECAPRLALKPGETKGTWVCTRPEDWGGPCEAGPLPDGACCRAVPRCKPVRSLRARRGQVALAVTAAALGALLVGLSGSARDIFINPRPLSRQHSGPEFAHLAAGVPGAKGGQGCVLCHAVANSTFSDLALDALAASRTSLRFADLTGDHPKDFSRMDRSCLACHAARGFHEADVARATSCPVCHREHQGSGPMLAVSGQNCIACHGDPRQMQASRQLSRPLPAILFERPAPPGLVVHSVRRPVDGYTEVITGFAADHPEFRVLRDKSQDVNTLRFNHRLHLVGTDIPLVDGRPLDCAYCHRPDASGAYMSRISFEGSCRACHALDFDERTPGMNLPHGNAAFVRAFLRSLPVQYADFAVRKLGISSQREVEAFVRRKLESLRQRAHSGEELEREVFLSNGKTMPAAGGGEERAKFAGCALCHDVAWRGSAVPQVTPPETPDRWLLGASFRHSAHSAMACTECHAAAASERTSDVILPTQQSCVRCHSPKGGVAHSCTTCHVYHNMPAMLSRGSLTAKLP